MAEFRLQLGADIDVVTPKELDEKITGLQGSIANAMAKSKNKPIRRDISTSYSGALVSGVPQVVILPAGKPPMGRMWNVTSITATGADDHTTVANLTVAVYHGDPATVMLGGLLVPGQTMPYFQSFSRHVVWIDDSEELFFVLNPSAGIAAQNIVINVRLSEYWDETIDQQYA